MIMKVFKYAMYFALAMAALIAVCEWSRAEEPVDRQQELEYLEQQGWQVLRELCTRYGTVYRMMAEIYEDKSTPGGIQHLIDVIEPLMQRNTFTRMFHEDMVDRVVNGRYTSTLRLELDAYETCISNPEKFGYPVN